MRSSEDDDLPIPPFGVSTINLEDFHDFALTGISQNSTSHIDYQFRQHLCYLDCTVGRTVSHETE